MKSQHTMSRWTAVYAMIRGMLCVGLALILNFAVIAKSPAVIVPIINAGFEDPELTLGAFTTTDDIPGWTRIVAGLSGVWHPTTFEHPSGAPEGNQVGYSNGATLSQVLPVNLVANGRYTLTVDIGNRIDPFQIVGYEVQLLAGGTVLGFIDETTLFPSPGTFETATVSSTADPSNPNIGQPLEIRLLSDGAQVSFDRVILDAVPIPPAVWLFGSGLLGLVGIARRKKGT